MEYAPSAWEYSWTETSALLHQSKSEVSSLKLMQLQQYKNSTNEMSSRPSTVIPWVISFSI